MKLPPIYYHYFRSPLRYARALELQEKIHSIQLAERRTDSHKDVLLLLQHLPVYTAGRRQSEESVQEERRRLTSLGADFVTTSRGGELTYHGPGQLVGYPLIDLSRWTPTMSIRDYICKLQKTIATHLLEAHGIQTTASEHTGVFLDSRTKVGSIGVQVRHRLTSHGFAFNVSQEPLGWFGRVVACGLVDVKASSVETAVNRPIDVDGEVADLVMQFGRQFEREMVPIEEVDLTSPDF
jgi:lipoyl(octanoyl) transferase 2